MQNQFSRTQLLLGKPALDTLAGSRVAVFGIGGVGGYVVEVLARSGVGELDLFDDDRVCLTNVNRQLHATISTIGRHKVDVAAERVADINPRCIVHRYQMFYMPANADSIDLSQFDYVVDCVDTVTAKLELVKRCYALGVPIISCMGAAYKLDPTAFRVADIWDTDMDPLSKVMRKKLRKLKIPHLKVVFSAEPPLESIEDDSISCRFHCICPNKDMRKCTQRHTIPASDAFVPAAGSESPLSIPVIAGSGSYLDLVLLAAAGRAKELGDPLDDLESLTGLPLDIHVQRGQDLSLMEKEDQLNAGARRSLLAGYQGMRLAALPDPDLARKLMENFSFRYPHENLRDLYTKTSVSDLKHAAMEEKGLTSAWEGEGAKEMFPEHQDADLPVPRFLLLKEETKTQTAGEEAKEAEKKEKTGTEPEKSAVLTGAARGTAIHRGCELIPYRRWKEPARVTKEQFQDFVAELLSSGEIPEEYRSVLLPEDFLPFLSSGIAARMAKAAQTGHLRREQPFVYALDAIQNPVSLFEPVYTEGGDTLYVMDQISDKKNKEEHWVENLTLQEAMERLGKRERHIINLRFFEGKTQMEVAEEVGISQAQVSRLEKSALKVMKNYLR